MCNSSLDVKNQSLCPKLFKVSQNLAAIPGAAQVARIAEPPSDVTSALNAAFAYDTLRFIILVLLQQVEWNCHYFFFKPQKMIM